MENLPEDHFVTSAAFTKQNYRDVYPAIEPSVPSNSQAGKVVIITGASKGLGRLAFATSFAKANPKGIVLVARTASSLDAVAKDIKAINSDIKVLAIPTDLTDSDSVTKMWGKVKSEFGHADVLINNAGTLTDTAAIKDADAGKWWHDFEVNIHGTFFVTQGFLKLLGEKKGTVINLTSAVAHNVFPNMSAYSLTKLITLQLAAFVAAENPNVSCIALHPGMVSTDMTVDAFERFSLDTPELVGGVGVWLATEAAAFLTGRYIAVNWSVEELLDRKEEILKENKLTMALVGKFGMEQFA